MVIFACIMNKSSIKRNSCLCPSCYLVWRTHRCGVESVHNMSYSNCIDEHEGSHFIYILIIVGRNPAKRVVYYSI